MSFRRKTYDGDLFGGSAGPAERRDTLDSQGEASQHAAPKRPGRINPPVDSGESLFAEEGDKDRYLITYADLITLLLGLFIILYAISNVDIKKYEKMLGAMGDMFGNAEGQKRITAIEHKKFDIKDNFPSSGSLKNSLQQVINENQYNNSVRLEENERGITIHILDDILFPSGTADLSTGSQAVLGKLAQIIKTLPNDIRVEGHTDNVPIGLQPYPSNWHLSVARALNTAYFLINHEGLSPEKVSIVGYSEYRPVASNNTPDGRKSNRRVDIVILR